MCALYDDDPLGDDETSQERLELLWLQFHRKRFRFVTTLVAPLPDNLWEGLRRTRRCAPSLAEAIDAARAAGDDHIGLGRVYELGFQSRMIATWMVAS